MEKAPFYLTKRKLKSGKCVWYYYSYDQNNNRTTPKSTGYTKKNEALSFCVELFQKGSLKKDISFRNFSKDWFTKNHVWVHDRQSSRPLAESTLAQYKRALDKDILPFFSNYQLAKITTVDIKKFRLFLLEKKLSPRRVNFIITVLQVMLNHAVDCEYIAKSPITKGFKSLEVENNREAFTLEELKEIFSKKWKNETNKLICLTAAVTGLRISECTGLQPEQIKNGYLDIDRQFYNGKLCSPKGDNRFVTLPEDLEKKLREISKGKLFVFTPKDKGFDRYCQNVIRKDLKNFFSEQMKSQSTKRKLSFHSFRYFFNTYLVSNNINEEKVNFIIGHSSGKNSMLKLYTTWKPSMYEDVRELQKNLYDMFMAEG